MVDALRLKQKWWSVLCCEHGSILCFCLDQFSKPSQTRLLSPRLRLALLWFQVLSRKAPLKRSSCRDVKLWVRLKHELLAESTNPWIGMIRLAICFYLFPGPWAWQILSSWNELINMNTKVGSCAKTPSSSASLWPQSALRYDSP